MTDAISIEQNNKIRVALGLKPLPVPGAPATDGPVFIQSKDDQDSDASDGEPASTLELRQGQAHDNWNKLQEEAEEKKRRQKRNDAIKRAREAAQRIAKLEGKTLGELEDADMDTKAWLMQHKKRQKKIEKDRARRLAEELAEREKVEEYTAQDLAGVRVGHELGDFSEVGEQVLTLKDTTIDENEEEGDELENLDLRAQERLKDRLDLKKGKKDYDPNDFENAGPILAKYDEEIEGKKRKRFTLDAQGMSEEAREAKRQEISAKLKAQAVSLDIAPAVTPSDYLEPTEIKVKKPKKKKTKPSRRRKAEDEDILPTTESTGTPKEAQSNSDEMELDSADAANGLPGTKKPQFTETFVDDEDLRASLAAQRRAALKSRKKVRPEDIARQLREESEQAQSGMEIDNVDGGEEEAPGLIIDETSEFVANLQRPTLLERQQRSVSQPAEEAESPATPAEETGDVDMDRSYNDVEDEAKPAELVKPEGSAPELPTTGLEEETTLDQGLGATLSMLKQRGLVKTSNSGDLNSLHRDRQHFLQDKLRREAEAERRARLQRERDRTSGKLDRMSARDREEYARLENKQRDQQESRQIAEVFNREYKPDVQLKYVDEHGRLMDRKEAFKHLSHQFHGKGSGKMKTEKHLKKIEDEKKREAMSTLDSSQHTGMNNAMGATARRNRQAGVRLG
ncbi:hypothetical protein AJ80_01002 [Polytolypa hystricis UAMH7299]|uniref:DNA binding protein SART-1 n=1 Tax=Polytolypa hystricis (strain UAMH7299) TaxID=1447883 RepID=A0A2B7Z2J9_POLH7|nr:hypothetical protein AJ80_01002 [Polytolypa hystricis UAMH7299]